MVKILCWAMGVKFHFLESKILIVLLKKNETTFSSIIGLELIS